MIDDQDNLPLDILESEVVYETSHSMNATDDELFEACECPRCGSHEAKRSLYGYNVRSYVKNYGYLVETIVSLKNISKV